VNSLKRFSTVRFPDTKDGKLVYIVHTPRRAFRRSGNWPLDMLFVIHHDKLETEYHEILDYSKTIRGDVYFAIAAMVKLSENKTVVVLYRRAQLFEHLKQVHYICGIKEITNPSCEDLSQLTEILNENSHDSVNGWNFVQKRNLDPAKRTIYAPNPMSRDFHSIPSPNGKKKYHWNSKWRYQKYRHTWMTANDLQQVPQTPYFGNYYPHVTYPTHIMGPISYVTSGRSMNTTRHVLKPLTTASPPVKPNRRRRKQRQTQNINWSRLMEGLCSKKRTVKANDSRKSKSKKSRNKSVRNSVHVFTGREGAYSNNNISNRSPESRQRRKVSIKNGNPLSSKTSSDVSLKDVQSSDVDFKEQVCEEKVVKSKRCYKRS